jgi:hypothetical protein
MKRILTSVALSLLWLLLAYLAWALLERARYDRAFEQVTVGEPLGSVLAHLGSPSHLEPHRDTGGYDRGERSGCNGACWLRLWYEVPLTLGTAPISVDFDAQQKVIRKYRWSSP